VRRQITGNALACSYSWPCNKSCPEVFSLE
jgi:hypothetical protein